MAFLGLIIKNFLPRGDFEKIFFLVGFFFREKIFFFLIFGLVEKRLI